MNCKTGRQLVGKTAPEETIEDILAELMSEAQRADRYVAQRNDIMQKAKQEALDRINKLMNGVIGSDEPNPIPSAITPENHFESQLILQRNKLRAAQRQRLAKLFKGMEMGKNRMVYCHTHNETVTPAEAANIKHEMCQMEGTK